MRKILLSVLVLATVMLTGCVEYPSYGYQQQQTRVVYVTQQPQYTTQYVPVQTYQPVARQQYYNNTQASNYYTYPQQSYSQPYYNQQQYTTTTYQQVRPVNSTNVGGALVGAAVGGLAGSRIGRGNGRLAATAAGAALGAVVGGNYHGYGY